MFFVFFILSSKLKFTQTATRVPVCVEEDKAWAGLVRVTSRTPSDHSTGEACLYRRHPALQPPWPSRRPSPLLAAWDRPPLDSNFSPGLVARGSWWRRRPCSGSPTSSAACPTWGGTCRSCPTPSRPRWCREYGSSLARYWLRRQMQRQQLFKRHFNDVRK